MALDTETLGDMPRDGDGLGAAVAALDPEGRAEDPASQVDLFASSPLISAKPELVPAGARGRPPGALNKTTEAWRSFILRNYRSPLLFLADLGAVDPFELAKALGCTRLEAIKLVKDAQAELAPYLHRKQPIAIDGGEDAQVPFFTQVIVDAATLGRLLPQVAVVAGESDAFAPVIEGEVAGGKSQDGGEGSGSD